MSDDTNEEPVEPQVADGDDAGRVVADDVDPAQDAAEEVQAVGGDGADDGDGGGNAEAARYRRKLRDAEAREVALAGVVEGYQRAEVERIAGAELKVPAGIWAKYELADMLGADGQVDEAAVKEGVQQAVEQLGLAKKPPSGWDPSQGHGGSDSDRTGGTAGMLNVIMGKK